MVLLATIDHHISSLEEHLRAYGREDSITPVFSMLIDHFKNLRDSWPNLRQSEIIEILKFIECIRYHTGFLWGTSEYFQLELQRHHHWTTGLTTIEPAGKRVLAPLSSRTLRLLKDSHLFLTQTLRYALSPNNDVMTQAIRTWQEALMKPASADSTRGEDTHRDLKIMLPDSVIQTSNAIETRIDALIDHAVKMNPVFENARNKLKTFLIGQDRQDMQRLFLYEFNNIFRMKDAYLQPGKMFEFEKSRTQYSERWEVREGRVLCHLEIDTQLLYLPPSQCASFDRKSNAMVMLAEDYFEYLRSDLNLPSIMKGVADVEWIPSDNKQGFDVKVTHFEMDIVPAQNITLEFDHTEELDRIISQKGLSSG